MSTSSLFYDFTVAIPTYNGAKRIPDVLEHLKWQLGTNKIRWEVIVVDNNSSDNTEEVVRRFQKKWPSLRYAFEPKQGAGYARKKAIRLARSPFVGFLDDDNLPSAVWVNQAYKFLQEHPNAGVIGSRLQGRFESEIPNNFDRIAPFLALTDRGCQKLIYQPEKKILPPGAGMVVRREAWLENVPDTPVLGGRAGKSMLTGEDVEAVLHIQNAGWEVWYNPGMRLEHVIPPQRLTGEYLAKLMRGIGLSRYRTRMLSFEDRSSIFRLLIVLAYGLNDLKKIVIHLLKYRSAVWRDGVTRSEMTLYLFSLFSPIFFLTRKIKKAQLHPLRFISIERVVKLSMQDQHI